VPDCARTTGDAGGFRFSLDGGITLAPNGQHLANVSYSWDLDVDPRDRGVILELQQGRLFRSTDSGCTFENMKAVPPGDWDNLTRAPSEPDVLVLTSVFGPRLAYSRDGGTTWTTQDLPDDVMDLAIDSEDPWRWTFVGRRPAIYARSGAEERWTAQAIPMEADQSVIAAAHAQKLSGLWLVASATDGLYRSDDGGETWAPASDGLFAAHGEPSETTTAVVASSMAFAPSNSDIAFAVVNQVGRDRSLRGVWRSGDGGRSWSRRVANGELVGSTAAHLTGGTRVFVSPSDPDWTFFAFGMAYDGYGVDLFRSHDGLESLDVSHFTGFYKVYAMAFGPPGTSVVYVGASSDVPSE
jgi:hypothetical protein